MTCKAAACSVTAVAAVQWTDLRSRFPRSRAEPVCEGHRAAFVRLIRDRPDPAVRITWLTLTGYGTYLAREAATVRIGDLFS